MTAELGPGEDALLTDLYELTMARAYAAHGFDEIAVFELFVRELPAGRRFLLAAGIADLLERLARWRFTDEQLDYLRGLDALSDAFVEELRGWRFTGEIWAVPEGTAVFEGEPIVQVVAPLPQAQVIETLVVNRIHLETALASKAARVALAAGDRAVVDFGARRAHGADAALALARASRIAGFAGTSNLAAGRRFGIPVLGTMAHSYVEAHEDERAAFRAFLSLYPETVLLIDTYDTSRALDRIVELRDELGAAFSLGGIRIDSGDLVAESEHARKRLDQAGLTSVRILASGGLDEYEIERLAARGAPIDGFGVGTHVAVAEDRPFLDAAYKLVSYGGRPRMKLSAAKSTLPGRKQVFRERDADGRLRRDTVARFDETGPGEPLLEPVFRDGAPLPAGARGLEAARERARAEIAALPEARRVVTPQPIADASPVTVSERLEADRVRVTEHLRGNAAD